MEREALLCPFFNTRARVSVGLLLSPASSAVQSGERTSIWHWGVELSCSAPNVVIHATYAGCGKLADRAVLINFDKIMAEI